ncbi:MAG: glycosyltransferase family 2 protein [Pelagimonas sp.]|jgi:GT2 family glycosyltransferase|nr:glycosyltransferase family 2 protein [Pelagimonas sp.]
MAIISLTSIPPRFDSLSGVLHSLRNQSTKIDEIRVYLPKRFRRFPDYDQSLPRFGSDVNVIEVEEDLGPASKVLHAVQDLSGDTTPILFCDDDRRYPRSWAETLLNAHRNRPKDCIAIFGEHFPRAGRSRRQDARARMYSQRFEPTYRLSRIKQQMREFRLETKAPKPFRRPVASAGYVDALLGYSGACVLSSFFDEDVFQIPEPLRMVDDIWLSGQLAKRGIKIWLPKGGELSMAAENDKVEPLRTSTFFGLDRDGQNTRAISHFKTEYGIWSDVVCP